MITLRSKWALLVFALVLLFTGCAAPVKIMEKAGPKVVLSTLLDATLFRSFKGDLDITLNYLSFPIRLRAGALEYRDGEWTYAWAEYTRLGPSGSTFRIGEVPK